MKQRYSKLLGTQNCKQAPILLQTGCSKNDLKEIKKQFLKYFMGIIKETKCNSE